MTQVWDTASAGRVRVKRWRLENPEAGRMRAELDHRRQLEGLMRGRERRSKRRDGGGKANTTTQRGGAKGTNKRQRGEGQHEKGSDGAFSAATASRDTPSRLRMNITDTPWGNYDTWGPLGHEKARRQFVIERLRKRDEPWNASKVDLVHQQLLALFAEDEHLQRQEEQFARQNRRVDALIEREMAGNSSRCIERGLRRALASLVRRMGRADSPNASACTRTQEDAANMTGGGLVDGARGLGQNATGGMRHLQATGREADPVTGDGGGSAVEDWREEEGTCRHENQDDRDNLRRGGQVREGQVGVGRCNAAKAASEEAEVDDVNDDAEEGESMDEESAIALLKGVPGQVIHDIVGL